MQIHPVRAVLFHEDRWVDRWTAMMKLNVALHNFANMPNNRKYNYITEVWNMSDN
jgi:hypothetical protein